jgi:hypothetical protein
MTRYYFWTADCYLNDSQEFDGCLSGVMPVEDDKRTPIEVFQDLTEGLKMQAHSVLENAAKDVGEKKADLDVVYFAIRQFYRVD